MKCKHVDTEAIGFYKSTANPYREKCWDCGAWLSLGPANDDDPRVQVELRGLEWSKLAPFDESRCTCDGCQSRELANVIANHKEQP